METTKRHTIRNGTRTQAIAYRRRGVGYVYFLGAMMLIAVIGLSARLVARIQLRTAGSTHDSTAARLYAQSAIELGMAMMQRTSPGETSWGAEPGSRISRLEPAA